MSIFALHLLPTYLMYYTWTLLASTYNLIGHDTQRGATCEVMLQMWQTVDIIYFCQSIYVCINSRML